jgi:hypothetical protein
MMAGNLLRLQAARMAQYVASQNLGVAEVVTRLLSGQTSQDAQEAVAWVDDAIQAVRGASDGLYKDATDEEIATVIMEQVDA